MKTNGLSSHNLLALLIGITLAAIASIRVDISLVIIIAFYSVIIATLRPGSFLAFIILLLPFSVTDYLSQGISGIPGLKVMNVFLLLLLFVFVLNGKQLRINSKEMFFLFGTLVLMSISVFRSIPYLNIIGAYRNENLGVTRYIASYLIKPTLYLVPFFIIVSYIRSKRDLSKIFWSINISLAFLSCAILSIYVFDVANTGDFRVVRYTIGSFFGMHGNTLAEFYVLGYPLILTSFLQKRTWFRLTNLVLAIVCIALLYCRSAYVLTFFSTFAILILNKRTKWLPVFIMITIIAVSFAPSTVVERGLTGVYGTTNIDIDEISAGRVENIWIPILQRLKNEDIITILIGMGKFSIAFSSNIPFGHAHNMYLEALLEIGLLGLSFFLFFYFIILKDFYVGFSSVIDSDIKGLLQSIFVSVVAWLINGMVGRHFFPDVQNTFLWILLGMGWVIVKAEEINGADEKQRELLSGSISMPFTAKHV